MLPVQIGTGLLLDLTFARKFSAGDPNYGK